MMDQIDWKKKCDFLQKELASMMGTIQNLQKVTTLNKDALFNCQLAIKKDTSSKAMEILIKAIKEENNLHISQIEILTQERNHALAKVLISEQIADEAERNEQRLLLELQNQVKSLTQQISTKDSKIILLENGSSVGSGLIVKFKEIASVDDKVIKMHDQIERMNITLVKYYNKLRELQDQKEDLVRLNFVIFPLNLKSLSSEIIKLQLSRQTPKAKSFFFKDNDPDKYIQSLAKLQRHIILDDSMDEPDHNQIKAIFSPIFSPLPLRVRPKITKIEQIYEIPPILDLTQALQIQQYNLQRLRQQLMQKNDSKDGATAETKYLNMSSKCDKLTKDLLEARNRYLAQSILSNQLESLVDQLKRQQQDAIAVNETLTQSNKQYENKWKKTYHTLEYYRNFYVQYKDLILNYQAPQTTNTRSINQIMMIEQSSCPLQSGQRDYLSVNYYDIDKAVSNSRRLNNDKVKDLSFMNSNEEIPRFIAQDASPRIGRSSSFYDNDSQMNMEQYKKILLSLAKDVASLQTHKINVQSHRKISNQIQLLRRIQIFKREVFS